MSNSTSEIPEISIVDELLEKIEVQKPIDSLYVRDNALALSEDLSTRESKQIVTVLNLPTANSGAKVIAAISEVAGPYGQSSIYPQLDEAFSKIEPVDLSEFLNSSIMAKGSEQVVNESPRVIQTIYDDEKQKNPFATFTLASLAKIADTENISQVVDTMLFGEPTFKNGPRDMAYLLVGIALQRVDNEANSVLPNASSYAKVNDTIWDRIKSVEEFDEEFDDWSTEALGNSSPITIATVRRELARVIAKYPEFGDDFKEFLPEELLEKN